jgi:hypothetical protein
MFFEKSVIKKNVGKYLIFFALVFFIDLLILLLATIDGCGSKFSIGKFENGNIQLCVSYTEKILSIPWSDIFYVGLIVFSFAFKYFLFSRLFEIRFVKIVNFISTVFLSVIMTFLVEKIMRY